MIKYGVYVKGDRKKRLLSYISEKTANNYARELNKRIGISNFFVVLEINFILDENYKKQKTPS